jgi:Ca-activated chloride channel family protein
MIVFITDGEPTVGETDMEVILRNLRDANRREARVFVFGVGTDVNAHLLDRIAVAHRGLSDYLTGDRDIDEAVSSFFRKVSEPILSDVGIDFGGIRVEDVYPVDVPDIFNGTQLVLLGRFRGKGRTTILLTGRVNGKREVFEFPAYFRPEHGNDFLPRLWARRTIGYLLGEIRLHGEKEELVDEIVRLSTRYGIITPYTSYLVLEDEAHTRDFIEPLGEAPALRSEAAKAGRAMKEKKGGGAVQSSLDINEMQQTANIGEPGLPSVAHAGGKTFYLQEGVWRDAAFREGMKVTKLRAFSRGYFSLLRRIPALTRYAALSANLLVVIDDRAYLITE